jgi:uncharacterized OB-fold protein
MSNASKIAINTNAADSDPRFVAPELVGLDTDGSPHLVGGRCKECGTFSFPRAAICSSCLSEEIETVNLGDQGTLYSYSLVHQAPRGWTTPYALGYVDMSDNVRVLAHLDVSHEALAIDMPLRLSVGVVGSDDSGAPLMSYTFTKR